VLMDVARVVPEDENGNGTHAAERPVAAEEPELAPAGAAPEDLAMGDDLLSDEIDGEEPGVDE